LKKRNISIALADAGGDIALGDAPPEKNGWSVGINLPEQENELMSQKLELRNCAVATSGDVYNYILHDGKKYSHIIDPRTGYGVTNQRNVTVIANDGATADWLLPAQHFTCQEHYRLQKGKCRAAHCNNKNEKIVTYKTKLR
jgi:thiamine biosynthesis lipoprotein